MKIQNFSITSFILIVSLKCFAQCYYPLYETFELVYKWQYVNFTWPDYRTYTDAINTKTYIPENTDLVGMKIYKDTAFFTTPRLRRGVPATLSSMTLDNREVERNKLLTPYPSWEMNSKINDCSTIQSVMSMEIDKNGIMWVIDGERLNNISSCPCKLWLFDLERNGSLVHSFTFPDEIASSVGGFVNDIVLDKNFAFISENSAQNPGLIVYSRKQNKAWKFKHQSMRAVPSAANFTVEGYPYSPLTSIDGVALSPKTNTLYYSPLTGYNLYSISTDIIKNEFNSKIPECDLDVKTIGRKQSQSDGMTLDNKGNLYYSLLPLYAVGRWNIRDPFYTARIIYQNRRSMIWPDSFTFDSNGYLYSLSSNIGEFLSNRQRNITSQYICNVFRVYTGTKSYINN